MKPNALFACCAIDLREKRMAYFSNSPAECTVPKTEKLETTSNAMKEGVEKAMKETMKKLNLTCINDVANAPVDKILPILKHMQTVANQKTIWNSAFLDNDETLSRDDRYLFYAALQRGMKILKPDLNLTVDGRITGTATSQTNQAHKSIAALDKENAALKKGYFTTEFLNAFVKKLETLSDAPLMKSDFNPTIPDNANPTKVIVDVNTKKITLITTDATGNTINTVYQTTRAIDITKIQTLFLSVTVETAASS